MKAIVEPLPLVPATWMVGGSRRWGSPRAARMRHIRSSDRSMRLGCNAVSRATMESIAVICSLQARYRIGEWRYRRPCESDDDVYPALGSGKLSAGGFGRALVKSLQRFASVGRR